MTDLEINRVCADAIGEFVSEYNGLLFFSGSAYTAQQHSQHYDPLHDNFQAMVLVKHFRLNIGQLSEICKVFFMDAHANITEAEDKDLNRAICLCVAALKGKNESQ